MSLGMAKSDMNFHVGTTDYLARGDLDLYAKTVHSVGKSKAKDQLGRKPTLWDQVAKEKHDQDLAIENRNANARNRMNRETAQFLMGQMDQNQDMTKMEKDQVHVDKEQIKQEV